MTAASRGLGREIALELAGQGADVAGCRAAIDDFDHVWRLNTRSTFFLSQHVAKGMRANGGGAIVNMASQAGLVALPLESAYCAAKAAVAHLTQCLAVEWGGFGIRATSHSSPPPPRRW